MVGKTYKYKHPYLWHMKVALSRKGFDSEYGGYPSPILPNNRMISFPIPLHFDNSIAYSKLRFDNQNTYFDVMKQLNERIHIKTQRQKGKWIELTKDTKCHLDPDIYRNVIRRSNSWKSVFGQTGTAQSHLKNKGIGKGDLFLFFGTFRRTICSQGEWLKYIPNEKRMHVIFGYLQIGDTKQVGKKTDVPEWMSYHPHTDRYHKEIKNNTVYIAKDTLSWNNDLLGAGVFIYDNCLVLTKEGYNLSQWNLPPLFKKLKISYHSPASWMNDYFQSRSRGQEFVIEEDKRVEEWARKIIDKCSELKI